MKNTFLLVGLGLLVSQSVWAEQSIRTIHDLPEAAFNQLNTHFGEYRMCMSNTPLPAAESRQQAQENANALMQDCDTHLTEAQDLMQAHDISEGLAVGLTNSMRGRAARQLMAKTMNTMAAQSAIAEQAETP